MIVNQIDWRRLHRHEPPDQRCWPMAIRTLRDFLIRLPEELDGVILSKTDDPVVDLLRVIGTQPADRKATEAGVRKLLADGYLVHEGGALRIRNFKKAQTGLGEEEAKSEPRLAQSAQTELSDVRRAAGRKGGLVSQANKQTGSSKTEQTSGFASSKTEQTTEQNLSFASSKTEQSASARAPEDQRREEKETTELPSNSTTLQDLAHPRGQAKPIAKAVGFDLKATAELWLRSRVTVETQLGDCTSWPEVKKVLAAFKATYGADKGEPAHGGDDRAKVILERFADGCTPETLVEAIQRSRFAKHMQEPEHQRLLVILRTKERVDTFSVLTASRKAGEREPQPEDKSPEAYKLRVEER